MWQAMSPKSAHEEHQGAGDCAKLEAHACECYAVVKREADRLLPVMLE